MGHKRSVLRHSCIGPQGLEHRYYSILLQNGKKPVKLEKMKCQPSLKRNDIQQNGVPPHLD